MSEQPLIGFIGQGWIGKHYADDFENRGFDVVRYAKSEPYRNNKERIAECDIVFIAVPTPTTPSGFDAGIVHDVISLVGPGKVAVIKSTVLPGTTEKIQEKNPSIFILHSPEFLTEATAAHEAAHPKRNIIGVPYGDEGGKLHAKRVLSVLPRAPYELICTASEAEFIKYASNCSYYFQTVYINLLYDLVERHEADWRNIREAMSADPWIGQFHLSPIHKGGRGAGGDCLPKDFAAFAAAYEREVGDALGVKAIRAIQAKNVDLLVRSRKDIEILERVVEFAKGARMLIVTQKVDRKDDVLGFFYRWIEEFAKQCEKVTVICLEKGESDLPGNVRVLSLGKESGVSRVKYIFNFYKYIWRERKNYDAVFVHMNPIYVVLGGIFWKLLGKKIAMWYMHRHVDWKLRVAEKFCDLIFTGSEAGFRLPTGKLSVLTHGVDVTRFKNPHPKDFIGKDGKRIEMVSVGRITPIKNLDTLIEACAILKAEGADFRVRLIGAPTIPSDQNYLEKITSLIKEKKLEDEVRFEGSIPNIDIAPYYWESDFSINLCPTGGLDKAVIESMAARTIPIVSNKAFETYFGDYAKRLIFKERDPEDLASKMRALIHSSDREKISAYLESRAQEFDTVGLIGKISSRLA
ncbi:glycosyltransferase [bacterium]|nr:glycosyltransferase [bacterium]